MLEIVLIRCAVNRIKDDARFAKKTNLDIIDVTDFYLFLSPMQEETGVIKDHGHLKSEDISRDDYFMDVVRVLGEKATCNRGKS